MITNKVIGVLAGGTSAERDVSLRSGKSIYKALLDRGYNAVFIDTAENFCASLKNNNIEIAFMALHGGHGENGAVQGLLEVLGIPYTGSGILASALAMDKEASKKIFLYHDIAVPPFVVVSTNYLRVKDKKGYFKVNGSELYSLLVTRYPLLKEMEMPWVVKPATEGSSIGVSIVKREDEIAESFEAALSYGERIIVEKYIKGKEIQIGILDDRALGGVEVRPKTEFYSYEAKYGKGLTEYILPPEVDDASYNRLKDMALRAHNALGCKGATRVDLILNESGKTYVLEVNTIPGMTETSLLPKIAGLAGMDFGDLVEEILRLTLSRQN